MQILDTEITSKKSLDRTFFFLLPSLGSTELTTNSSSFSRSIALTNPEVVLKRRPQFGTVGRRKKGFQLVLYHTQPGIIGFFSFRIGNTKEYSQSKEGKVGLAKVGVVSKQ